MRAIFICFSTLNEGNGDRESEKGTYLTQVNVIHLKHLRFVQSDCLDYQLEKSKRKKIWNFDTNVYWITPHYLWAQKRRKRRNYNGIDIVKIGNENECVGKSWFISEQFTIQVFTRKKMPENACQSLFWTNNPEIVLFSSMCLSMDGWVVCHFNGCILLLFSPSIKLSSLQFIHHFYLLILSSKSNLRM